MRRRLLKKDQLRTWSAYDFYVRAVSIIYNAQIGSLDPVADGLVNLSEAVDLLNKAVARDPNFFLGLLPASLCARLDWRHPRALGPGKVGHRFCISVEAGFGGSAPGAGVAPLFGSSDYDRARAELALAQQSLPNNPQVYELAGLMDRSQRRWADAIHNLERACELDPRNLPYLINLGGTYLLLHDYDQHAKIMDRIVALDPEPQARADFSRFRRTIPASRHRAFACCN